MAEIIAAGEPRRSVHLRYVGDIAGTPAGEIEPGDRLMWNGGVVYVVLTARDVSPCFVEITERPEKDPDRAPYTRRLAKARLVACAKPGQKFRRA